MLCKTLGPENFGTNGGFDGTTRTVEKLIKNGCFVRNQPLQAWVFHARYSTQ